MGLEQGGKMNSARGAEGDIRWSVVQRDGGGWDISELEVAGRNALEPKIGAYETQEHAKKEAIVKAKAFAKLHDIELR